MKYGLLGTNIINSYSPLIHGMIADYNYELCQLDEDGFNRFLLSKNFNGISITMPYKTRILNYLDYIDDNARNISAVNTVVNRNGSLYGYNTDYDGLYALINRISKGKCIKNVLILGTGGTSNTAAAVLNRMGCFSVKKVSRFKYKGDVLYGELESAYKETDLIINTTPCGMVGNDSTLINVSCFNNLIGVVDAVYNPLRTKLVIDAQNNGIPAEGGLYMLVKQAVKASELFLNKVYPAETTDIVYNKVLWKTRNIVLIGMPGCGKTTVGKILANKYCKDFIDTDEIIEKSLNKTINRIFSENGEVEFRKAESKIVHELSNQTGKVIAVGGGTVLNNENIYNLKKNGILVYLKKQPGGLALSDTRPLAKSFEQLCRIYDVRKNIYRGCADISVETDCLTVGKTVESVYRSLRL